MAIKVIDVVRISTKENPKKRRNPIFMFVNIFSPLRNPAGLEYLTKVRARTYLGDAFKTYVNISQKYDKTQKARLINNYPASEWIDNASLRC
jgi:hypothetical protein